MLRLLACLVITVTVMGAERPALIACAGGATASFILQDLAIDGRIDGPLLRLQVRQVWRNPATAAVDAIYTYPLPHRGAVDGFTLETAGMRIRGVVLERGQAEQTYTAAKADSRTAALLAQERPDIFTQQVANIPGGATVAVEVAVLEALVPDRGIYEAAIPVAIGERYDPAGHLPTVHGLPGVPTMRVRLHLAPGLPFSSASSPSHPTAVTVLGPDQATLDLAGVSADRDVVLRWALADRSPRATAITHRPATGPATVLLHLEPQAAWSEATPVPTDLCLLIDVSGSMGGAPLAQARRAAGALVDRLGAQDRVQVVTFAGAATQRLPDWTPLDGPGRAAALAAIADPRQDGGGTEMLAAFRFVLAKPPTDGRRRIVVLLSDGFIGNEDEIHSTVAAALSDLVRFWALGIGNRVNRHLIDGIGGMGGGLSRVLTLDEDPLPAVDGFVARIRAPAMTGVGIDWGGLVVRDAEPAQPGDLWPGMPLQITARCDAPGRHRIAVTGTVGATPVRIPVVVDIPAAGGPDSLPAWWARTRVERLRREQLSNPKLLGSHRAEIIDLGVTWRIMTPYTAFVAVGERIAPAEADAPAPQAIARWAPSPGSDMQAGGAFMAIGAGGGSAGMYGMRSAGGRKRAVAVGGGSKGSESAVVAGLRWLKGQQHADGTWSTTAATAATVDPIRTTARAALVLLGAGYDHKVPNPFKSTVARAVTALVAAPATGSAAALRAQALCEAFGMTNDPDLKAPCETAVVAVLADQRSDGSWGDAARTQEAAGALMSAQGAGIQAPGLRLALDRLKTRIDRQPAGGWDDLWLARRFDRCATLATPAPTGTGSRAVMTLAMYWGPRADWMTFSVPQRDALVAAQERGGDADGSWPGEDRLDATIDGIATLSVYYRYEPVRPRDQKR